MGLQEEHLLTTVSMEKALRRRRRPSRGRWTWAARGRGDACDEFSPDQGFTGYGFKHGQHTTAHAGVLDGVLVDHSAGWEMDAIKSSTGQGFAVVCLRVFDGVSHTMETRYKENFPDGVYLAHSEDHLIGSCPARVCDN